LVSHGVYTLYKSLCNVAAHGSDNGGRDSRRQVGYVNPKWFHSLDASSLFYILYSITGNPYFFPFDDVVSIGPCHELASLNGSALQLTKVISSYQESLASKACCLVFRQHEFVLAFEKDPKLFQVVVTALRTLHDRGQLAPARLPEFIEEVWEWVFMFDVTYMSEH
jgi:hypothetical protein